jgi:hypothetical protein
MLSQLKARSNGQPDLSRERNLPKLEEPRRSRDVVAEEFLKRAMKDESSDSEEDAPPESKVWEISSDEEGAPDILDPKYDWRRESRRGKRSRKNYSKFLADRIRENEDELREEREAQEGVNGPDFS